MRVFFVFIVFLFGCEEVYEPGFDDIDVVSREFVSVQEQWRECRALEVYIDNECTDEEIEIIEDSVDALNSAAGGEVMRVAGVQYWLDRSYEVVINDPSDQMIFCIGVENEDILGSYNGTDIDLYVPRIEKSAEKFSRSYEQAFECIVKHEIVHMLSGRMSNGEHIEGANVMHPTAAHCVPDYSYEDSVLIDNIIEREMICSQE